MGGRESQYFQPTDTFADRNSYIPAIEDLNTISDCMLQLLRDSFRTSVKCSYRTFELGTGGRSVTTKTLQSGNIR